MFDKLVEAAKGLWQELKDFSVNQFFRSTADVMRYVKDITDIIASSWEAIINGVKFTPAYATNFGQDALADAEMAIKSLESDEGGFKSSGNIPIWIVSAFFAMIKDALEKLIK